MLMRNEHAFEICYDTAAAVLDHSELYFSDLPGGSGFVQLRQMMRDRGHADVVRAMQELEDLLPSMRQWLSTPKVETSFTYRDCPYQLAWESPAGGTGILFLSRDGRLSLGALLLSGLEPAEPTLSLAGDELARFAFTGLLTARAGDPSFERAGALKLVHLTRRPVVGTVFWRPIPQEDSDVRTIERLLAFRFFREHGVVREYPVQL